MLEMFIWKLTFSKVWAGNEDCEPVTWEECELVNMTKKFPIPKIDCVDGPDFPWMDCETVEGEAMVYRMTCEVKKAVNCEAKPQEKCLTITYDECTITPRPECESRFVYEPYQEFEHKKKCLLDDDAKPNKRSNSRGSSRIRFNFWKCMIFLSL